MNRRSVAALAVLVGVAGAAAVPAAQEQKPAKKSQESTYDEQYARYLEAARASAGASANPIGWMTGLSSDLRARNVNDLITIRVVESISAVGSADSNLDKASSGTASVTKFFGIENKLPASMDPTSLASLASNTKFKGGGATSRTGDLSAVVTARVTEVLPNGDLVVESAREIEINGDRQVVVLSGVVRPADVNRNNVALSTAVGQLRIRYFGRGLIKDNLSPGWFIRIMNKIF